MSTLNKNEDVSAYIMSIILKMEEIAITVTAVYFLTKNNLGLPFWAWLPLFLSPDIAMLGYIFNSRIGAYSYNLFHHRGIALLVGAMGLLVHIDLLTTIGILLFAHSSFDRMMGYGLKFEDNFKHTHLGWVGRK